MTLGCIVHEHLEVSGRCWFHSLKMPHRSRLTPRIMRGSGGNSFIDHKLNQIPLHRVMTILREPLMCALSTKLGHLKHVRDNYFSGEGNIVSKCQFSLWAETKDSESQSGPSGPWSQDLNWGLRGATPQVHGPEGIREILHRNMPFNVFIFLYFEFFNEKRQMYTFTGNH